MTQNKSEIFFGCFSGREQGMAEQVAQLLDEKSKVLESLSQCQQEVSSYASSV